MIEQIRPKVAFINLGCRVNRVEIDAIAQELESAGCEPVDASEADLVVINTCAVTGEAEAKARKAVRRAASLAKKPVVIATGCVVTLFADELSRLADNVIVEPNKAKVAARALELLGWNCTSQVAWESGVLTPTGRVRPGIKIQDGCDNRCTYCIVWRARGASRSVAASEVVRQVQKEIEHGVQEVVLTGINLGRYEDTSEKSTIQLPELLKILLEDTSIGRIRLSSIEPQDITPALLDCIATSEDRIAPFLHIPLQSGCEATLRRMGRACSAERYERVVMDAYERIDGLALGCDLIVGFPQESDEEFEESISFCERMRFSRMHVFRYSKRPGTIAASMPGQIDPKISAERARRARELAVRLRHEAALARVGHDELVCIQTPGQGVSGGLFDVQVSHGEVGQLVYAHVKSCAGDLLNAREEKEDGV